MAFGGESAKQTERRETVGGEQEPRHVFASQLRSPAH